MSKQLKEEERWNEEDSLFGLPKVAHRKSHAGRKAAAEEAAEETGEGETAVEVEDEKPEK
jgi:hypothetical protein